jgi:hypothetical protein
MGTNTTATAVMIRSVQVLDEKLNIVRVDAASVLDGIKLEKRPMTQSDTWAKKEHQGRISKKNILGPGAGRSPQSLLLACESRTRQL